MQPIEQRWADRAARKEENAKLNAPDNTGNDRVGNVLAIVQDGITATESLTADERRELSFRIENGQPSEGYKSSSDGLSPFAGIGVLHTAVVPAGAQAGNGAGAYADLSPGDAASANAATLGTDLPAPTDAASGEALARQEAEAAKAAEQAAASWGAPVADETVDADGKPLTASALKKLLDGRNVTYETDANVPALQALVKANPAPKAA